MNIKQGIGRTNARHNESRYKLTDAICRVGLSAQKTVDYIEMSPELAHYMCQYARSCGLVTPYGLHTFMNCAVAVSNELHGEAFRVKTVDAGNQNPFIKWAMCNLTNENTDAARSILLNINRVLYRLDQCHQYTTCVTCGQPYFVSEYPEMNQSQCFTCNFWDDRVKLIGKEGVYVCDGNLYKDAGNNPNERKDFLGHGGNEFRITTLTGKVIETNNLWHSGRIPSHYQIEDNCSIVSL